MCLLAVTLYAYWVWYRCVRAQMHASVNDAIRTSPAYFAMGPYLAWSLAMGLLAFECTRRRLPRFWRWAYVLLIGFGGAVFAVHWIQARFGPRAFWM